MTLEVPGGTTAQYGGTNQILFARTQVAAAAGDGMPAIQPRTVPVYSRLHAPQR